MRNEFEPLQRLTSYDFNLKEEVEKARDFASLFGWQPSYILEPSSDENVYSNVHIIVEYGLENTAVISFLRNKLSELTQIQKSALVGISYNNLVDWHICVDESNASYIYNRYRQGDHIVKQFNLSPQDTSPLRYDSFEKLVHSRPSPTIMALDDAIISTISFWKRQLSAMLNYRVSLKQLSSLFNALIFCRALEDNRKRYNSQFNGEILLEIARESRSKGEGTLFEILSQTFKMLLGTIPIERFLLNDLHAFDDIDILSSHTLIKDFYENRNHKFFRYDFSVISKHALSKIYEKYVAILKLEENPQMSFFNPIPIEKINKSTGTAYTPEYIAKFFAAYIEKQYSRFELSNIKFLEPAIGSGVFVRTILETLIASTSEISENGMRNMFNNFVGIDTDTNACNAADLSIALLYLNVFKEVPNRFNIYNFDFLDDLESKISNFSNFDVVITNPPFVNISEQQLEVRNKVRSIVNSNGKGRMDIYFAFLIKSIELLKEGGFGLFVLPHSFLIASSAENLRKVISDNCWIKCLVDLSAIRVFENKNVYTILIIFQKKVPNVSIKPNATIVKCRDYVGRALNCALYDIPDNNDYYSIYECDQSLFHNDMWNVLSEKELRLKEQMEKHPKITDFGEILQGVVTGRDSVFIVNHKEIPAEERSIYVPLIQDRNIDRYQYIDVPEKMLIYPLVAGKKLTEEEFCTAYPKTWSRLMLSKDELIRSKSVTSSFWWIPVSPRKPSQILKPKIIMPHLMLLPKFTIDTKGGNVVSRSPYIIPKDENVIGDDLLFYLLAILNSSVGFWYISTHSHKYDKGYAMLELRTMKKLPIPDPKKAPLPLVKKVIDLVKIRMGKANFEAIHIDNELDNCVSKLYGLNEEANNLFQL